MLCGVVDVVWLVLCGVVDVVWLVLCGVVDVVGWCVVVGVV